MAKISPTSFNVDILRVSQALLDQRWNTLSNAFRSALNLDTKSLSISPDYQANVVWAGFFGKACEKIKRNRGGDTFVAPLFQFDKNLRSWIGFQEVWDVRDGRKPFEFRQLGLTVHFGYDGDPIKPQIFRAEWMGVQDRHGKGAEFHSSGAGHPHWQIDVLESLKRQQEDSRFEPEENSQVEEFDPEKRLSTDDLIKRLTLERMHFASAAQWWSSNENTLYPAHLNAPANVEALTRWVISCVQYIKQEIQRCELPT